MSYKIPIWVAVAKSQIGVAEIKGNKNSKRILEYAATTTLKATNDEVPWCSSFVNWVLKKCDIKGTDSAAARSWVHWGLEMDRKDPPYGSIVILSRGLNPHQGHVGFFVGNRRNSIQILGGNQGDKVCIENFPKSRVISYRWPR